jgi:hypothetical protein
MGLYVRVALRRSHSEPWRSSVDRCVWRKEWRLTPSRPTFRSRSQAAALTLSVLRKLSGEDQIQVGAVIRPEQVRLLMVAFRY